jgi:hypothetical protein
MKNRYLNNIFINLKELSDIEFQRKAWFNKIPNYVSSYYELMCSLFDDCCFDLFVDKDVVEFHFSNLLVLRLRDLRNRLNLFEGKDSDKSIFEDPEWIAISNLAKEIVTLWEAEIDINDYS